jgi:hypothetical protein
MIAASQVRKRWDISLSNKFNFNVLAPTARLFWYHKDNFIPIASNAHILQCSWEWSLLWGQPTNVARGIRSFLYIIGSPAFCALKLMTTHLDVPSAEQGIALTAGQSPAVSQNAWKVINWSQTMEIGLQLAIYVSSQQKSSAIKSYIAIESVISMFARRATTNCLKSTLCHLKK